MFLIQQNQSTRCAADRTSERPQQTPIRSGGRRRSVFFCLFFFFLSFPTAFDRPTRCPASNLPA